MTTRINQRQVGSKTATHLGDQLNDLDTKLSALEQKAGFLKGVLATETELPAIGNPADTYFITDKGGYLVSWSNDAGWVNLSSKPDPVIDGRVANLENISMTVANTYTENFTAPIVDAANTTAIVGTGYVKAGRNFKFEAFDNQSNMDTVNSSGILITNGKCTITGGVSGTYFSKEYTTTETVESAIFDPNITHYDIDAWFQTNSVGGSGTDTRYWVYRDANNKVWYFWGASGGTAYFRAFNSDGTEYKPTTVVAASTVRFSSLGTQKVHRVVGCVDRLGQVWVAYESNASNSEKVYVHAVNADTGANISWNYAMSATVAWDLSDYTAFGLTPIGDKVIGIFSTGCSSTGSAGIRMFVYDINTPNIVAVTGSLMTGLPTTAGFYVVQADLVPDPGRNRLNVIAMGNDGYIYTATIDSNGTQVKGFGVSTSVKFEFNEFGAIYDPDLDQIVITGKVYSGSCLRIIKLNGASLDQATYWDYPGGTSGNLCRVAGVAKPTSTSTAGASGAKLNDGDTNSNNSLCLFYGIYSGCWAQVDLTCDQYIGTIKVLNGGAYGTYAAYRCTSFTVGVSSDGVNFTSLGDFSGLVSNQWVTATPSAPVKARYIRVYNMVGASDGAGITEIEAYPPKSVENIAASVATNSQGVRLVKGGNNYFIAYPSTRYVTNPPIYTAIVQANDGLILEADKRLSADNVTATSPKGYMHPDGAIRIAYMVSGGISEGVYKHISTSATYYLSNNSGVNWYQATPGQQLNFPSANNKLKVKIALSSPSSVITPDLFEYTIRHWNSTTPTNISSTFTSGKLPAVQVASKAVLTASQALNGGTIQWYISNDGGTTWNPYTLGNQLSFALMIGPDVRVKAVLTSTLASAAMPTITQFTLLTTEIASSIDIHNLQTNLMKTNFKLDSYSNASKNSMKNMVIDVFNDTAGIDTSKSNYTFDSANKCVSGTTVQSKPDTTTVVPATLLLATDEVPGTGMLTYSVSRDGGTTWTEVIPGFITSLASQPAGTSLVMKANLTGNAKLNAWAYSWS